MFTAEHDQLRAQVRRFVESELRPHALDWEREGDFPNWVFKRMGDLGLLGLRYPPEYGGQGGDWSHAIVLAEELARIGSGGVGMAIAVQTEMATPPILRFGTEEQRQRYLAPAIRGERIACLGISEPDAGSDVANIQTAAVRDGEDWVITGRKTFITNGRRADFCLLVAWTSNAGGTGGELAGSEEALTSAGERTPQRGGTMRGSACSWWTPTCPGSTCPGPSTSWGCARRTRPS
jgi:acyl-CoA dehydrogenase